MAHNNGHTPKYKIRSVGGVAPELVDRAVDVMAGITVYDILTRRPQFKTDLIPNEDRKVMDKDVCCFGLMAALALDTDNPSRHFRADFMSSRLMNAGYSPERSTDLASILIRSNIDRDILGLRFLEDSEPDYGLLVYKRERRLDEAAFVMGILSLDSAIPAESN